MSNDTVSDSGVQNQSSPRYQYRYYSTNGASTSPTTIVLVCVGTAMSVSDYGDLATQTVTNDNSILFCMVDHNPGNIVKLNGNRAADALNDLATNFHDRFGGLVSTSNPVFAIGGHSAGGSAVVDAMETSLLSFVPVAYVGIDPFGSPAPLGTGPLSRKSIPVPTLAVGFTVTTCGVNINEAGKKAYEICTDSTHRVLLQIQNPLVRGEQITHCIFTDSGCASVLCPSHNEGAWVRQLVGKSIPLFLSHANRDAFVDAIGANAVNLFVNDQNPEG